MKFRFLPLVFLSSIFQVCAAEPFVLFPNNRAAYLSAEPIEISIAGMVEGDRKTLSLNPGAEEQPGLAATVEWEVVGDGSTVHFTLPPNSLAPGVYTISLDGAEQPRQLTVAHGVPVSTMRVSQTTRGEIARNFSVSNLFSTGIVEDGQPVKSFHGPGERSESAALQTHSLMLADNLPSLVYMYWTGFVTHKPWGVHKSWANGEVMENMRLFNFSAAQILRRYRDNTLTVGPIDEPGLAWGRTPAGGSASGFPGWDEQPWYEERGWNFTNDITSRGKQDFLDYLRIRTKIIRENYQFAKDDFRRVWPDVVWGGDLYAPHAIMDGTDPFNQVVNDVVTTHVFTDWGVGKFSIMGSSYLEKSHDPLLPVAHAMNGQLFDAGAGQVKKNSLHAYFLVANTALAAGLQSNWWLNTGDITPEDLSRVNEALFKMGPLFQGMRPEGHPVAVLWSYTNLALLQYPMAQRESAKEEGGQIPLMVADYPELEEFVEGGNAPSLNAYSIGGDYKAQVLWTHSGLNRAGHPAHILHEDLLPDGILANYKVLAVPGLRHELPENVRAALQTFVDNGGKIVADRSTTIDLPGMIRIDADFTNAGHRWSLPFALLERVQKGADTGHTLRDAAYFRTNHFMESFNREAAPAFRAAMANTATEPVLETDSVHLGIERHLGGEGAIYMVINGYEELPEVPEDKGYPVYNYAALKASYTLHGIPEGSAVYKFEGLDWDRVTKISNPDAEQKDEFEPAEMKIFLVAPREPEGLDLTTRLDEHTLTATASLRNLKMPWPLHIKLTTPSGGVLYEGWRATAADGTFKETFPLGANAPGGDYTLTVRSPADGLEALAAVSFAPTVPQPVRMAEDVRLFDGQAIREFLATKPPVTIAVGENPAHRATAEELAAELRKRDIPCLVKSETDVMRKALYPRVWDPYMRVHSPKETSEPAPDQVIRELEIESLFYETADARTATGEAVANWRTAGTLLTVTGDGFIDINSGTEQFAEPGVKIFVGADNRLVYLKSEVKEVRTTPEFRRHWERPWKNLSGYNGGFNLTPQLPQAWRADDHLILLGDSQGSELVAALQASEILPQLTDKHHPGPGKSLLSHAWSPFALEKNVIFIGASDEVGLQNGVRALLNLVP